MTAGATGPQTRPLAVLLVDDDEDDHIITRDMLASQDRARFAVEWCPSFEAALPVMAEQRHDVYLIDYHLGERTGLELVHDAFPSRPRAPVILLTGQSDYQIDLEAAALGVTDYLVKQELNPLSLERSIRYAVSHQRALADLARSEERYALAARAANDGIWEWDVPAHRMYFSPRWHTMLGHAEPFADGDPDQWLNLVHEADLPGLRAAIDAHLAGQTSHLESEHRIRHADGTWRWVLTRGVAVRAGGKASRMAGSMSDITERRRAEHQLQHDAFHDPLTGLPNRALFMDRLEHTLQFSRRDPSAGCGLLFIDIDRFKLVNDTFTHAVGDDLLVVTAARIAEVLRPGDTVARIGGDEFTILLDDIGSAYPDDCAMLVAERVLRSLAKGFQVDGHQLYVTASIGISISTPALTAADLLRNSDIAMYHAKRRGGGRYELFDQSMHRQVVNRLSRENDLRRAVEDSLLGVHYQPVVSIETGQIRGFEALARWPEHWPAVPPAEFIPVAEETGLIRPLGGQVLRAALAALVSWRRMGLVGGDVFMSVNVSGRQLDDPGFPEDVLSALAHAGLPGNLLRLEITEGVLMREPERMKRIISEVCSAGVGLELDDFGTGYSSLAALHQIPVDTLKIDRSFVASLGGDGEVIVRSTVALAHSLGLQVIAEGIERPAQVERLRALGCEYGQGYLFSKPLALEAVEDLLAGWSTAPVSSPTPALVGLADAG